MSKIFCLIGQNYFLIEAKIKEITNKAKRLSFNKDIKEFFFELEKESNQKLIGQNNDLIIKNIEKLKNNEQIRLISYLRELKIKIIFIFSSEPTEFFSLLRKNKIKFEIINISEPRKNDLENFIKEFLRKRGLKLSQEILEFLKENYADNFDLLFRDLEKISYLDQDNLNKEDLTQLISFHPNIFKIQNLFFEKNWPNFIHSFKKLILEDKSKNSFEALNVLSFLFSSLLKVYLMKNYPGAKIEGHYYYLAKLKEKVNKLDNEELKKLILCLAKTDKKIKKFYLPFQEIPEDIALNYLFYR